MDDLPVSYRHELLAYWATHVTDDTLSFRVHYWGIERHHYDNPLHKHNFFEICYVLEGEGRYVDHDQVYPLRPGTLFMSRPGVRHQILSASGMFLIYVAFEVEEAKSDAAASSSYRRLATSPHCVLHDAGQTATALIWRALLSRLERVDPLAMPFIQSAAHALLVSFYAAFAGGGRESERALPSSTRSSPSLNKAMLYIRDNLSPTLTVADVARYMHVSSRHLTRLFHEELQMSCSACIQQEKIRLAIRLLQQSDLSVAAIAEQAGFASVHYFTRVFTKLMKVPPGKFRRYG